MICLRGCDDSTRFEMELNEAQLEFLKEISKRSREMFDYGCMPALWVEKIE